MAVPTDLRRGAEGSEELAMVTKLLGEMIDAITNGFGELHTEPIPDFRSSQPTAVAGISGSVGDTVRAKEQPARWANLILRALPRSPAGGHPG